MARIFIVEIRQGSKTTEVFVMARDRADARETAEAEYMGAEALSATMNVAVDTLTDEVEPYLLRRHFIVRTPRGRRATPSAYRHLGLNEPPPEPEIELLDPQRRLFE